MTDFPWKSDARGNTSAGAYASANAYANAYANASANANANANANASLSFRPLSTAIRLQERAVWSIGFLLSLLSLAARVSPLAGT